MIDFSEGSLQPPMLPSRRDIALRLFRQRRVFAIVFVLVFAAFVLTKQFAKKYDAQMQILVRKERVDSVLTPASNSTPNLQALAVSEEELNSEVELLKGNDLLSQVVVEAKLAPEQDHIAMARALRALTHDLDAAAIPKTNLIAIKYTSGEPETAQRVLQSLGAAFLKKQQALRGSSFEIQFLNDQLQQHRSALQAAKADLLAFTRKTGVVSASLERDLTIQEIKAINEQELEARAATAQAAGRTATLGDSVAATPSRLATVARTSQNVALLQQLKSKLLELQLKRSDLLAKYDPHYRLVQDVDSEITLAQKLLADEAASPLTETSSDVNPVLPRLQGDLATSQAELSGLRARTADLARSSAQLRNQATALQVADLTQDQLLNTVKTEQAQYQLYLDKREEALMAASLDREGILNVVIAQPPAMPALPNRSTSFVFAAALFCAFLLGAGIAFIADILDPTIRNPAELEEMLAIPLVESFDREFLRGRA